MRQQDFAAAAEVWEEQLKTDPRDISAWRGLGQCRIAQAQYPDAIKAFTAAIELDPDDSELYLYRSDVYRHLGDEDAALADFQRGNQLHSDAWARVSPDAGAVAVVGGGPLRERRQGRPRRLAVERVRGRVRVPQHIVRVLRPLSASGRALFS